MAWILSAVVLVNRMETADQRGASIRAELLNNEHVLSTVSTESLLSAVYLRDVLLDSTPDTDAFSQQLRQIRARVDGAIADYEPRVESAEERRQWNRLRSQLNRYWEDMPSVLTLSRVRSQSDAIDILQQTVIPQRDGIVQLANEIHDLGRRGLEEDQQELATSRLQLRRRVWQISGGAVVIGMGIAFLATRRAGQLEEDIRRQHKEVLLQKNELERLSAKLMEVQEQERRRLSRELHDEVGQALSAVKLELAAAERKAGTGPLTGRLDEARAITDQALQAVRDVSQLLHPSTLDDLGLPDTVEWFLKNFSRRSHVKSDFVVEGNVRKLPPAVAVCGYRVIQEAATNIARHSEATACEVKIARRPGLLMISVSDNGVGFDPANLDGRGLGLVSIRERVAGLGGRMTIDSQAGRGTQLTMELPMMGDNDDDTTDSDS